MKTVKPVNGGVVERVKDEVAAEKVGAGTHVYCAKKEYKKLRDGNKPKPKDAVAAVKVEMVSVLNKAVIEKRKGRPQK